MTTQLTTDELLDAWPALTLEERTDGFSLLSRVDAEDLFLRLDSAAQCELLQALPAGEQQLWLRVLPPDDAADLLQQVEGDERAGLLARLDAPTRNEVNALLAYAEDQAGGLMNPRFARLRPEMSVDEAISYLRRQTRETIETIYYAYVLDGRQRLLGVISLRELVTAAPQKRVADVMLTEPITVPEEMDQESVSQLFADHDLTVLPVVDAEGRMRGIVTVDDIVDVVREEATEDIQKIGGVEALDAPYLDVPVREMLAKRGFWLGLLFFGQLLTATVIGSFERAPVQTALLALFMPLILSSGGNAGSQAATLVVRALSLGEVKTREWLRVLRFELVIGLSLGVGLALLGFVRVMLGGLLGDYGAAAWRLGSTVSVALICVVIWGTLLGSMLPLLLRRAGFDPATASTPLVATFCDVTGLVIYFGVAGLLLKS